MAAVRKRSYPSRLAELRDLAELALVAISEGRVECLRVLTDGCEKEVHCQTRWLRSDRQWWLVALMKIYIGYALLLGPSMTRSTDVYLTPILRTCRNSAVSNGSVLVPPPYLVVDDLGNGRWRYRGVYVRGCQLYQDTEYSSPPEIHQYQCLRWLR